MGKLDGKIALVTGGSDEKGHFDVLVANAGVVEFSSLDSITEEHFDNIFNINVKGVLFTVQKALPIFSDGGSIILVGSGASIKGFLGESVYSATKAAIRSFARCWTVDLKDRRIRLNTLSPGAIDTSILQFSPDNSLVDKLKAATSMNRLGKPEEIATVAVFLASDDSSYITGIELFVDGGIAQI